MPNKNTRNFGKRIAMNTPIQGTAADIIKIAMIKVRNRLKEEALAAKLILQVHDELVFDVCKEELEMIQEIVRDKMLNALPLSIPIEVNLNTGENWLEAH